MINRFMTPSWLSQRMPVKTCAMRSPGSDTSLDLYRALH
jgi:hypothetical protein